MEVVGGVVAFCALVVGDVVLNGFVLSVLWGWFMVPVFGLPALSIVPAVGISIMASLVTDRLTPDYVVKDRSLFKTLENLFANEYLNPLFFLFLGWIVHLFM